MNTTSRVSFAVVRALSLGFFLVAFSAVAPQKSVAALLSLIDDNSSADFDTATQGNNYNWFVGGTDILAQQAFWYRIGNAVPEQSVHTLPILVQGTTDANFNGAPDTLFVRYNGGNFQIDTKYSLDGGLPGSGTSDMGEQISISNLTASPLDFHFFQYADFDLSAADTIIFANTNTVDQTGAGLRLSETVVTPVPSHHEAAFFPVTLNKLNDGLPTTLIDNGGAGPGDVTWAFQWDFLLPGNSTFLISKDKHINNIPEPAAASLLSVAAGLLLAGCRKHRRA
jgi:large repetitive protein